MSSNEMPHQPVSRDEPLDVDNLLRYPYWCNLIFNSLRVGGQDCSALGPLANRGDLEKSKYYFPSIRGEEMLASVPYSLQPNFIPHPCDLFRDIARQAPNIHHHFLSWLNRVESFQASHWKNIGIYDLMQLSRRPLEHNLPMLIAALLFWNRNTNCLHVPYGPVTPTLLDVAVLTGLRPDGAVLSSNSMPVRMYGFRLNRSDPLAYMDQYCGHAGQNLHAAEHIAFLALWLHLYVFCIREVSEIQRLIPLAAVLHEGRTPYPCLSKLLLARLYASMGDGCLQIRSGVLTLLEGPFWLMQLWLNAIFSNYLEKPIPTGNELPLGQRLSYYYSFGLANHCADLEMFINLFAHLSRGSSLCNFPPFRKELGPDWLRMALVANERPNPEAVPIWENILRQQLFISSFPGAKEMDVQIYLPNCVARQFGMIQCLPFPLNGAPPLDQISLRTIEQLDNLSRDLIVPSVFEPPPFAEIPISSMHFDVWWGANSEKSNLPVLIDRLRECCPLLRESKTEGISLF